MALLADGDAADALTARSATFSTRLSRARGSMGWHYSKLILMGIYFSVPNSFSEVGERALVAEMASILPKGIKLEYEERFAAKLSHEIKNYALLMYDGSQS